VSTSTGAPLNLTKPDAGDTINLGVLNANYDSINTLALDHETRLDVVEANNWVTNVRIASGVDGSKVTSGTVYDSTRWAGRKLYVATTAPTSGVVDGDVWLKVQ
jgi:hypothetical protein